MWYGILWVAGVALANYFVYKILKHEGFSDYWIYSFSMYIIVSLIIGARLGHCLFYDPLDYLLKPYEFFKIWEGGLASHGGAIGMLIGVCLFSLKYISKNKIQWEFLLVGAMLSSVFGLLVHLLFPETLNLNEWEIYNQMLSLIFIGFFIGLCIGFVYLSYPYSIKLLDRLIIGVAIGSFCIRLENLMNSEIFGGPTSLSWGFNFYRSREWIEMGALPCHPTQIYEALVYFLVFIWSMFLYWKTSAKERIGLILGVSLLGIFGSRFLLEFIKNVQVSFEEEMFLNQGQLLSIPFIIWSIYLIWNASFRHSKKDYSKNNRYVDQMDLLTLIEQNIETQP